MKVSYKNKKLEKSLTKDVEIQKTYGTNAKKVKQRIRYLQEADNLSILQTLPALRLHPYKGDRKELWSIDIHKNWRILFKIDQDPIPEKDDGGIDLTEITYIKIMSIEDPH